MTDTCKWPHYYNPYMSILAATLPAPGDGPEEPEKTRGTRGKPEAEPMEVDVIESSDDEVLHPFWCPHLYPTMHCRTHLHEFVIPWPYPFHPMLPPFLLFRTMRWIQYSRGRWSEVRSICLILQASGYRWFPNSYPCVHPYHRDDDSVVCDCLAILLFLSK